MDPLTPKSHGEEVAVFRHGLIGAIALRSLTHGERISLLRSVSEQRVRPPGSDMTRCYSVPTLERWLYAFKRGGLVALVPQARTDKGRGRDLPPELRDLLCDIRREHPEVTGACTCACTPCSTTPRATSSPCASRPVAASAATRR
jgi:hypothetical protein